LDTGWSARATTEGAEAREEIGRELRSHCFCIGPGDPCHIHGKAAMIEGELRRLPVVRRRREIKAQDYLQFSTSPSPHRLLIT
ncbi:MAG: hypothetical protein ACRD4Q_11405, partial [Candidatus Acidiferrales bacterium]